MKLATLKDGSRDGRLIVVSRDLATALHAQAAPTLQAALDGWHYVPRRAWCSTSSPNWRRRNRNAI
jgi:fumarylacetoacetate (FAA) hydrolase